MTKPGVGVAVGRFQIHRLHEGHRQLLRQIQKHSKSMVCVGVRPAVCTPHDPLDFPTRAPMIKEFCPNSVIVPLPDVPSDEVWSKQLDSLISIVFPTDNVTIYQGRDSFQGRYLGQHKVVEIEEIPDVSGTNIRESVSRSVMNSEEFRWGVMYGATNQFARIDPVVDICVYKEDPERGICILLGQEAYETEIYRLPGGHIEARESSAEHAARRELAEETGLEAEDYEILDQLRVTSKDAPGYAMFTTLFLAKYTHGPLQPGSDIARLYWAPIKEIEKYAFSDNHQQLVDIALETLREI
jgi:ADP-ribose pyrophosphatase YjhB (NUDIX family)/nicotinamide mononucleotide adenylyltransferase